MFSALFFLSIQEATLEELIGPGASLVGRGRMSKWATIPLHVLSAQKGRVGARALEK